jgi:ABC-type uncharacterized transport system substrate-binding protein
MSLAACSAFSPAPETPAEQPELSAIPPIGIERMALPQPERRVTRPAAGPVAILVSRDIDSYVGVAESLTSLLGADDPLVFLLDDAGGTPELAAEIAAQRPRAAIAIGLPAALFASEQIGAPVIFCQVFNYAEHPSLLKTRGGVSVLPAFSAQLDVWRTASPKLSSVGAIVGPGHDELLEDSRTAAERAGLTFSSRISRSDQETVYQFKRLASEIDGFWLVPDNRILSISAIREMLEYALGHDVEVVVSTPELLSFGALMSFAPSVVNVADAVYGLLSSVLKDAAGGFEFVAPTQFDVQINPDVAERFGIGMN